MEEKKAEKVDVEEKKAEKVDVEEKKIDISESDVSASDISASDISESSSDISESSSDISGSDSDSESEVITLPEFMKKLSSDKSFKDYIDRNINKKPISLSEIERQKLTSDYNLQKRKVPSSAQPQSPAQTQSPAQPQSPAPPESGFGCRNSSNIPKCYKCRNVIDPSSKDSYSSIIKDKNRFKPIHLCNSDCFNQIDM